jgi:LPS export ABC transporter permease LptG
MKFLSPVFSALNFVWRLIRQTPHLSAISFLLALLGLFLAQQSGYHIPFMPKEPSTVDPLPRGWVGLPDEAYIAIYLLSYMRLFVFLGGVVFHIHIFRSYPNSEKMLAPTWMASIYLAVWAVATSLYDFWENSRLESLGEEVSLVAFIIQMLLTVGMILSVPVLLTYYTRCKIMERYVLSNFLQPLVFCFIAFCSLWIVMDLLDNLNNFKENHIPMGQILMFYLRLIPYIYVSVAPVTILLATLYSLGKMCRANELISMLGAGKSLAQVLRPIFIFGAYASFIGMTANYHWAPVAEGNKKTLLEDVADKMSRNIRVSDLVYRNQEGRRTWYVGVVPYDLRDDKMRRIEVRQEDENGKLAKAWYGRTCFWWAEKRVWSFYGGVEVTYEEGKIVGMRGFPRIDLEGWSETPWGLVSNAITPEFLGVPELLAYVDGNKSYSQAKLAPFRTHLFYRFALPWQCLVIVLVAAPLGVVFSRRGMLGGVASSIFIFFILIFIDNFFLNLGKGNHLAPWFTVWVPHIVLASIGGILFYFRSQNKDFPKVTSIDSLVDSAKFLWNGLRGRTT